jgi:hypothetical protein
VYRGTWTNIDIAAKEYLAVDECEKAGKTPSELAMQRARVSKGLPALLGPAPAYVQLRTRLWAGVPLGHPLQQL